jgi:hypothetical protein
MRFSQLFTISLAVIIMLFVLFSDLMGKELTDIYQWDYELINRTVFVFSGKPSYRVEHQKENQQIVITLMGIARNPQVALNQNFDTPVLKSIRINEENKNRLVITIATQQSGHLKYFLLEKPDYKLVLDIYDKLTPENNEEKYIFAKFYYSASFFRRAEKLFKELAVSVPEKTGVNYFLANLALLRNDKKTAGELFRKVRYQDPEYLKAQAHLFVLGIKDTGFSDESAEAFVEYRNNFLRAGNLNRQQLLLALSGSLYGNEQEIRSILTKLDYKDPLLREMINNVESVFLSIGEDEELKTHFPSMFRDAKPAAFLPWYWYLIIILIAIVTSVIMMLFFRSVQKKRLIDVDTFSEEFPENTGIIDPQEKSELVSEDETEQKTTEEKEPAEPRTNLFSEKIHPEEKNEQTEDLQDKEGEVKKGDTKPSTMPSKDLKAELILQLHRAGWQTEAIANELETEAGEIEDILKSKNKRASD